MKAYLVSRVRKSVSEKLAFAKFAFGKSDFLDLVDFDFLDLPNLQWLIDFQYFYQFYYHQLH